MIARSLTLALAFLLAHVTVHAVELTGTIYISQPPFPCDGVQREAWYVNTSGKTQYITGGYVWQGVARGLIGDVGFQLYIWKAPGPHYEILRVGMWDHYAPQQRAEDNISPIDLGWKNGPDSKHYFTIEPYGAMKLAYGCALVGPQPPGIEPASGLPWAQYYSQVGGHHQQAFIYYSNTKP